QRLAEGQASAAQQAAESVAAIVRNTWPKLQVKALAAEGQPAEVLVQQAEKLNADTIVVGNKRAQGLQRILGSVSRNVASATNCELYIVNNTKEEIGNNYLLRPNSCLSRFLWLSHIFISSYSI